MQTHQLETLGSINKHSQDTWVLISCQILSNVSFWNESTSDSDIYWYFWITVVDKYMTFTYLLDKRAILMWPNLIYVGIKRKRSDAY